MDLTGRRQIVFVEHNVDKASSDHLCVRMLPASGHAPKASGAHRFMVIRLTRLYFTECVYVLHTNPALMGRVNTESGPLERIQRGLDLAFDNSTAIHPRPRSSFLSRRGNYSRKYRQDNQSADREFTSNLNRVLHANTNVRNFSSFALCALKRERERQSDDA